MCSAGGERTVRHNALRNLLFQKFSVAGFRPELDKPGLLLPANPDDALQNERRPADIHVPSWGDGLPVAFDFAVTAPQRQESIRQASTEALAAAHLYEARKCAHLGTQRLCSELGITFYPLVVETTGAWSENATVALKSLSRALSLRSGRRWSEEYSAILQGASVCIRRQNARAVMRRCAEA